MNSDKSSLVGGIQPQEKAGHAMLALSILKEAKTSGRNNLMALFSRRYLRADGSLGGDAHEIAEFVAEYCIRIRLSCPDCKGRLRSLRSGVEDAGEMVSAWGTRWQTVKRIFKCLECGRFYYKEIRDDIRS